jgi:two-component system response regulator LytT
LTPKKEFVQLKSKALFPISSLYFVKSDDKYVEFHGANKIEMDRDTLKNVSQKLSRQQFVQIHKSYLVNLLNVRAAYGNKVLLRNGEYLPVSRRYKKLLKHRLAIN